MNVIRRGSLPCGRACVASIGNFDGMHLGHQAMLKALIDKGRALSLPSVVILFEPQPQEYFNAQHAPARLMNLRDKVMFLQQLDVDYVYVLNFNQSLANLSADHFILDILVDCLQLKHLFVGLDFRFGHKRQGDIALLKAMGETHQYEVDVFDTVLDGEQRISSTAIREALSASDFIAAKRLLGRSFTLSGKVVHGEKRGRQIGVKTANLHLKRRLVPLLGVYRVKVTLNADNQHYQGVANIGIRPTFSGKKAVLEVHLFEFDNEIYGEDVHVTFIEKIRDEIKFDSVEALVKQIHQDIDYAKKAWQNDRVEA